MLDDRESVCVRYVCVNRFPDSCGECPIVGNPKDMTYRRSDCPLLVTES